MTEVGLERVTEVDEEGAIEVGFIALTARSLEGS